MDLAEKRTALIAEHQAMEKHDPHWRAEAAGGNKISERPIAFLVDDEVTILGDCVPKVLAALKTFVDDSANQQERLKQQPAYAMAVAKCKKLVETAPAPTELKLTQQVFNCVNMGLGEVGLLIVLTDDAQIA